MEEIKHNLVGRYDTKTVYLNGVLLKPYRSQCIINHSPDGFNWGYLGSGPAQLALAILLELTDKDTAILEYQGFKFDFISELPMGAFDVDFTFPLFQRADDKDNDIQPINNNC